MKKGKVTWANFRRELAKTTEAECDNPAVLSDVIDAFPLVEPREEVAYIVRTKRDGYTTTVRPTPKGLHPSSADPQRPTQDADAGSDAEEEEEPPQLRWKVLENIGRRAARDPCATWGETEHSVERLWSAAAQLAVAQWAAAKAPGKVKRKVRTKTYEDAAIKAQPQPVSPGLTPHASFAGDNIMSPTLSSAPNSGPLMFVTTADCEEPTICPGGSTLASKSSPIEQRGTMGDAAHFGSFSVTGSPFDYISGSMHRSSSMANTSAVNAGTTGGGGGGTAAFDFGTASRVLSQQQWALAAVAIAARLLVRHPTQGHFCFARNDAVKSSLVEVKQQLEKLEADVKKAQEREDEREALQKERELQRQKDGGTAGPEDPHSGIVGSITLSLSPPPTAEFGPGLPQEIAVDTNSPRLTPRGGPFVPSPTAGPSDRTSAEASMQPSVAYCKAALEQRDKDCFTLSTTVGVVTVHIWARAGAAVRFASAFRHAVQRLPLGPWPVQPVPCAAVDWAGISFTATMAQSIRPSALVASPFFPSRVHEDQRASLFERDPVSAGFPRLAYDHPLVKLSYSIGQSLHTPRGDPMSMTQPELHLSLYNPRTPSAMSHERLSHERTSYELPGGNSGTEVPPEADRHFALEVDARTPQRSLSNASSVAGIGPRVSSYRAHLKIQSGELNEALPPREGAGTVPEDERWCCLKDLQLWYDQHFEPGTLQFFMGSSGSVVAYPTDTMFASELSKLQFLPLPAAEQAAKEYIESRRSDEPGTENGSSTAPTEDRRSEAEPLDLVMDTDPKVFEFDFVTADALDAETFDGAGITAPPPANPRAVGLAPLSLAAPTITNEPLISFAKTEESQAMLTAGPQTPQMMQLSPNGGAGPTDFLSVSEKKQSIRGRPKHSVPPGFGGAQPTLVLGGGQDAIPTFGSFTKSGFTEMGEAMFGRSTRSAPSVASFNASAGAVPIHSILPLLAVAHGAGGSPRQLTQAKASPPRDGRVSRPSSATALRASPGQPALMQSHGTVQNEELSDPVTDRSFRRRKETVEEENVRKQRGEYLAEFAAALTVISYAAVEVFRAFVRRYVQDPAAAPVTLIKEFLLTILHESNPKEAVDKRTKEIAEAEARGEYPPPPLPSGPFATHILLPFVSDIFGSTVGDHRIVNAVVQDRRRDLVEAVAIRLGVDHLLPALIDGTPTTAPQDRPMSASTNPLTSDSPATPTTSSSYSGDDGLEVYPVLRRCVGLESVAVEKENLSGASSFAGMSITETLGDVSVRPLDGSLTAFPVRQQLDGSLTAFPARQQLDGSLTAIPVIPSRNKDSLVGGIPALQPSVAKDPKESSLTALPRLSSLPQLPRVPWSPVRSSAQPQSPVRPRSPTHVRTPRSPVAVPSVEFGSTLRRVNPMAAAFVAEAMRMWLVDASHLGPVLTECRYSCVKDTERGYTQDPLTVHMFTRTQKAPQQALASWAVASSFHRSLSVYPTNNSMRMNSMRMNSSMGIRSISQGLAQQQGQGGVALTTLRALEAQSPGAIAAAIYHSMYVSFASPETAATAARPPRPMTAETRPLEPGPSIGLEAPNTEAPVPRPTFGDAPTAVAAAAFSLRLYRLRGQAGLARVMPLRFFFVALTAATAMLNREKSQEKARLRRRRQMQRGGPGGSSDGLRRKNSDRVAGASHSQTSITSLREARDSGSSYMFNAPMAELTPTSPNRKMPHFTEGTPTSSIRAQRRLSGTAGGSDQSQTDSFTTEATEDEDMYAREVMASDSFNGAVLASTVLGSYDAGGFHTAPWERSIRSGSMGSMPTGASFGAGHSFGVGASFGTGTSFGAGTSFAAGTSFGTGASFGASGAQDPRAQEVIKKLGRKAAPLVSGSLRAEVEACLSDLAGLCGGGNDPTPSEKAKAEVGYAIAKAYAQAVESELGSRSFAAREARHWAATALLLAHGETEKPSQASTKEERAQDQYDAAVAFERGVESGRSLLVAMRTDVDRVQNLIASGAALGLHPLTLSGALADGGWGAAGENHTPKNAPSPRLAAGSPRSAQNPRSPKSPKAVTPPYVSPPQQLLSAYSQSFTTVPGQGTRRVSDAPMHISDYANVKSSQALSTTSSVFFPRVGSNGQPPKSTSTSVVITRRKTFAPGQVVARMMLAARLLCALSAAQSPWSRTVVVRHVTPAWILDYVAWLGPQLRQHVSEADTAVAGVTAAMYCAAGILCLHARAFNEAAQILKSGLEFAEGVSHDSMRRRSVQQIQSLMSSGALGGINGARQGLSKRGSRQSRGRVSIDVPSPSPSDYFPRVPEQTVPEYSSDNSRPSYSSGAPSRASTSQGVALGNVTASLSDSSLYPGMRATTDMFDDEDALAETRAGTDISKSMEAALSAAYASDATAATLAPRFASDATAATLGPTGRGMPWGPGHNESDSSSALTGSDPAAAYGGGWGALSGATAATLAPADSAAAHTDDSGSEHLPPPPHNRRMSTSTDVPHHSVSQRQYDDDDDEIAHAKARESGVMGMVAGAGSMPGIDIIAASDAAAATFGTGPPTPAAVGLAGPASHRLSAQAGGVSVSFDLPTAENDRRDHVTSPTLPALHADESRGQQQQSGCFGQTAISHSWSQVYHSVFSMEGGGGKSGVFSPTWEAGAPKAGLLRWLRVVEERRRTDPATFLIEQYRRMRAGRALRRIGRGMMVRFVVGRLLQLRREAAEKIQPIGRAFVARRHAVCPLWIDRCGLRWRCAKIIARATVGAIQRRKMHGRRVRAVVAQGVVGRAIDTGVVAAIPLIMNVANALALLHRVAYGAQIRRALRAVSRAKRAARKVTPDVATPPITLPETHHGATAVMAAKRRILSAAASLMDSARRRQITFMEDEPQPPKFKFGGGGATHGGELSSAIYEAPAVPLPRPSTSLLKRQGQGQSGQGQECAVTSGSHPHKDGERRTSGSMVRYDTPVSPPSPPRVSSMSMSSKQRPDTETASEVVTVPLGLEHSAILHSMANPETLLDGSCPASPMLGPQSTMGAVGSNPSTTVEGVALPSGQWFGHHLPHKDHPQTTSGRDPGQESSKIAGSPTVHFQAVPSSSAVVSPAVLSPPEMRSPTTGTAQAVIATPVKANAPAGKASPERRSVQKDDEGRLDVTPFAETDLHAMHRGPRAGLHSAGRVSHRVSGALDAFGLGGRSLSRRKPQPSNPDSDTINATAEPHDASKNRFTEGRCSTTKVEEDVTATPTEVKEEVKTPADRVVRWRQEMSASYATRSAPVADHSAPPSEAELPLYVAVERDPLLLHGARAASAKARGQHPTRTPHIAMDESSTVGSDAPTANAPTESPAMDTQHSHEDPGEGYRAVEVHYPRAGTPKAEVEVMNPTLEGLVTVTATCGETQVVFSPQQEATLLFGPGTPDVMKSPLKSLTTQDASTVLPYADKLVLLPTSSTASLTAAAAAGSARVGLPTVPSDKALLMRKGSAASLSQSRSSSGGNSKQDGKDHTSVPTASTRPAVGSAAAMLRHKAQAELDALLRAEAQAEERRARRAATEKAARVRFSGDMSASSLSQPRADAAAYHHDSDLSASPETLLERALAQERQRSADVGRALVMRAAEETAGAQQPPASPSSRPPMTPSSPMNARKALLSTRKASSSPTHRSDGSAAGSEATANVDNAATTATAATTDAAAGSLMGAFRLQRRAGHRAAELKANEEGGSSVRGGGDVRPSTATPTPRFPSMAPSLGATPSRLRVGAPRRASDGGVDASVASGSRPAAAAVASMVEADLRQALPATPQRVMAALEEERRMEEEKRTTSTKTSGDHGRKPDGTTSPHRTPSRAALHPGASLRRPPSGRDRDAAPVVGSPVAPPLHRPSTPMLAYALKLSEKRSSSASSTRSNPTLPPNTTSLEDGGRTGATSTPPPPPEPVFRPRTAVAVKTASRPSTGSTVKGVMEGQTRLRSAVGDSEQGGSLESDVVPQRGSRAALRASSARWAVTPTNDGPLSPGSVDGIGGARRPAHRVQSSPSLPHVATFAPTATSASPSSYTAEGQSALQAIQRPSTATLGEMVQHMAEEDAVAAAATSVRLSCDSVKDKAKIVAERRRRTLANPEGL